MNMKISKLLLVAIFTVASLQAQVGLKKVGQSTMNFLLVSNSARGSGLGEAFTTIGEGAESAFFNPAGTMVEPGRIDVKLYSTKWIAGINYMASSVVYSTRKFGTIGFNLMNVDYGEMRWTSLIRPNEVAEFPRGYKDLGKVSNLGAYSFGFSYAKPFSQQFVIGGNVRFVGQNLGQTVVADGLKDNNMEKLVFDAGVKYDTGFRDFKFGMSIRNFSSNVKREEISEQLPLIFTMGISIDLVKLLSESLGKSNNLLFAIDFTHPNNYSERMNIGFEYTFLKLISVRYGYQFNQDLASGSYGFGLKKNLGNRALSIDYSYSDYEYFDGVSRVSIGVTL